jgi:plasmid stability protein
MSSLSVPDIPDDVRAQLAARAAARGQSLPEYVRDQLAELARRETNREVLAGFSGRSDGIRTARGKTAEMIRSARAERDRQIGSGTE